MCSATHVAAGALLGSVFESRSIAFLLGFASHIPLDMLPHVDFDDFRFDAAVSLGLLAGIYLVSGFSPVLLGALGAVAPDFENLLWKIGWIREESKIFPTHSGLIRHGKASGGGLRSEIVISIASAGLVVIAIMLGGRH